MYFQDLKKKTFLGITSPKFKILVYNFRASCQLALRTIDKNLRNIPGRKIPKNPVKLN